MRMSMNQGDKKNAAATDPPVSTIAITQANLIDILPAAIGRLRFFGCLRSASRSIMSLMI